MSWWQILIMNTIVPLLVSFLQRFGIPALEKQWPSLIPLINEILALLGQGGASNPTPPSSLLQATADHFNALKSAGK